MGIHYYIACVLSLVPALLTAQSVDVRGEVRTRTEYRDGFKRPIADGATPAAISLLRTRLGMDYSIDRVHTRVTVQDSRVYGQTATSDAQNSLGIFEAWGRFDVTRALSVTLGRQAIGYDDNRLFTSANWSQNGRAHDLLLLKYENPYLINIHLGGAWGNEGDVESDRPNININSYKSLVYLWIGRSFARGAISAIWTGDSHDVSPSGVIGSLRVYRYTTGGNARADLFDKSLAIHAAAYMQYGKDTENMPLSAYMASTDIRYGYTKALTVTAGADFFSGSTGNDAAKGINKTFNKLYGSNNSFNGIMEYWTTPPGEGLSDLWAGLSVRPAAKIEAAASFHAFSIVKERPGAASKGIGSEMDISFGYSYSPQLTIEGGWSLYMANRLTYTLKGMELGGSRALMQWGYVTITFFPSWTAG
ncbi:MAG: alginate export family protein [Tannerellaceae bacterium]|jgi:hypothetical protein|nr:alginate export family protein [Tannerellaceae bacterium]